MIWLEWHREGWEPAHITRSIAQWQGNSWETVITVAHSCHSKHHPLMDTSGKWITQPLPTRLHKNLNRGSKPLTQPILKWFDPDIASMARIWKSLTADFTNINRLNKCIRAFKIKTPTFICSLIKKPNLHNIQFSSHVFEFLPQFSWNFVPFLRPNICISRVLISPKLNHCFPQLFSQLCITLLFFSQIFSHLLTVSKLTPLPFPKRWLLPFLFIACNYNVWVWRERLCKMMNWVNYFPRGYSPQSSCPTLS